MGVVRAGHVVITVGRVAADRAFVRLVERCRCDMSARAILNYSSHIRARGLNDGSGSCLRAAFGEVQLHGQLVTPSSAAPLLHLAILCTGQ